MACLPFSAANRPPSGRTANAPTSPKCPMSGGPAGSPVVACHLRTLSSSAAVTTVRPSGEKATTSTDSSWPGRAGPVAARVDRSHSRAVQFAGTRGQRAAVRRERHGADLVDVDFDLARGPAADGVPQLHHPLAAGRQEPPVGRERRAAGVVRVRGQQAGHEEPGLTGGRGRGGRWGRSRSRSRGRGRGGHGSGRRSGDPGRHGGRRGGFGSGRLAPVRRRRLEGGQRAPAAPPGVQPWGVVRRNGRFLPVLVVRVQDPHQGHQLVEAQQPLPPERVALRGHRQLDPDPGLRRPALQLPVRGVAALDPQSAQVAREAAQFLLEATVRTHLRPLDRAEGQARARSAEQSRTFRNSGEHPGISGRVR